MKQSPKTTTVYFDGECPLCTREISFYRHQPGGQSVDWVDIHSANPARLPSGIGKERLLARFHVQHANGAIVTGARAFIVLWQSLPRLRWLGMAADNRPVIWLLEQLYRWFLPARPRIAKLIAPHSGNDR